MAHIIDRSQVTKTYVKLDSGQVVEVEINPDGTFTVLAEETPAPAPAPAPSPRSEEEGEAGEETEKSEGSSEGEAENKEGKPDTSPVDPMAGKPQPKPREHRKDDQGRMEKSMDEKSEKQIRDEVDTTKLKDNAFKAQLTSVMTDNKFDRVQRGRTKGKIDMTRLYKVKAKSNAVFTQKMSRKGKNYNVVLVLDESGSMVRGGRIQKAAEAVLTIAKGFEGQVNIAIVGFNHFIVEHKGFDEPVGDYQALFKKMVWRASDGYESGAGCNHDYDALDYAYNMLKGREGENLVLFMSDGEPATCDGDDPYIGASRYKAKTKLTWHEKDEISHLHHLIKANAELATTIGLGIETKSWQVPDNVQASNASQMKPILVDILRKKIKRG